jgi:transglutaminase-like putative cysteine protease
MRTLAASGRNLLPDILPGDPRAVEGWFRGRFSYRPEHEEVIRTVPRMVGDLWQLGRIEGDCDDAAVFLVASYLSLGARARFVAIRYGGAPEFGHVFVEWFDGRLWITVDPTIPRGVPHLFDERMVVDGV